MATKSIRLRDKAYNGVHRFRFIIKKDGVVWSGIESILATFEKPDRTTSFQRSLTVESAPTGIWYYDSVDGDLDEEGYWTMTVQITDDTVVIEYPYEIGFRVTNTP